MPRGILGSLAICTVLFVLVSGVMVGLVPYKRDAQPAGAAGRRDRGGGRPRGRHAVGAADGVADDPVTVGALAALSSVMVVMMLAQPRIFLAMSKDGLLPAGRASSTRASRRRTSPRSSPAIVVALAAGLTPIGTLGTLVSIGTLMAFVIVSIGVIVLRRTRPDLPRPFRMPMVPLLPALSALVALMLMPGLPRATWERLIIWMVVGIVFYVAYGYRKQLEAGRRRSRSDS